VQIQVQTDRHVGGGEELTSFVTFEVLAGLGPCAPRVRSACAVVTVESSPYQGPAALRCVLEVGPVGHAPLAVTRRAATTESAIRDAVGDMRDLLERMFRRMDGRIRRTEEEPCRSRSAPTITSTATRR
jgi:hypothetical protein